MARNPTVKIHNISSNEIIFKVLGVNDLGIGEGGPQAGVAVEKRVLTWMRRNMTKSMREKFSIAGVRKQRATDRPPGTSDFLVRIKK